MRRGSPTADRPHQTPQTPPRNFRDPSDRCQAPTDRRSRRFDLFVAPLRTRAKTSLKFLRTAVPLSSNSILRAAIDAGARLAEPGEFTLRAFLNQKLDLVQAEAVADLIDAVTPLQARAAFDQLEGTLTTTITAIEKDLFDIDRQARGVARFSRRGLSLRRAEGSA